MRPRVEKYEEEAAVRDASQDQDVRQIPSDELKDDLFSSPSA
jgi:hypothetical protein